MGRAFDLEKDAPKSEILKRVFSLLRKELKLKHIFRDYEIFIYFLEKYAKKSDIEKFVLYNIHNFLSRLKEYYNKKNSEKRRSEHLKSIFFGSAADDIYFSLIKNYK